MNTAPAGVGPPSMQIAAGGILFDGVAMAIVRANADGAPLVEDVNEAFTRLTGYAAAEVVGQPSSFMDGGDAARDQTDLLERAVASRTFCDVEMIQYRRNGTAFWSGLTVLPAADGSKLALVLVRDVTAHRRTQDRLLALTERLRDLAMSDPLTGVGNRRSFDTVLERDWKRAARDGRALSLAMVDIDHFKTYNDRFGHPAGDTCLKAVAEALEKVIRRPTDFLARYGGEEFAILMPDMDGDAAAAVAGRLVEAVRRAEPCPPNGNITISCGVASAIPGADDGGPALLLHRADRALYSAKAAGRDCVHQILTG